MSGQQRQEGSQGRRSAQYAEAMARELSSLKQEVDHLAATERDLESQRVQLQAQITRYTEQAPLARRANRPDLAGEAEARVAQLQPELLKVQEQLGRVVARQKEITSRQFELLRQTPAFSSSQLPRTPTPRKPRKRRRVLIGLAVVAVLVVLASLGVARLLRPGKQPAGVTQTQPRPTPTSTSIPSPTPPPLTYPFHPDGSGPPTSQCERYLGFPCYSPEQIQQAFNLPALYKQGYDGYGQTIVILGTGNTSTLQTDLHHFDQVWGLPDPPSFQIVEPSGPPVAYTCADKRDDLQIENTLDVEWSHAIAPGANIILVIGSNDTPGGSRAEDCAFYGLFDALQYALNNHLGQVVSISYAGSELGDVSETASQRAQNATYFRDADAVFQQAAEQQVTVVAGTGDDGATNHSDLSKTNAYWNVPNVGWPASDPYVLAVGGTTLQVQDASGTYGSERVWDDPNYAATGGGLSSVFPEPDYQQRLPNQGLFQGKRGIPDVAFPAEANYDLYASFETGLIGQINTSKWNHWDITGGTSTATPCWAGLIAIADQMSGSPLGFIQPALYSLRGKDMHDITRGNNSFGGVTGYSAQPGYDLTSGWGTPVADQLLSALVEAVNNPTFNCPGFRPSCG